MSEDHEKFRDWADDSASFWMAPFIELEKMLRFLTTGVLYAIITVAIGLSYAGWWLFTPHIPHDDILAALQPMDNQGGLADFGGREFWPVRRDNHEANALPFCNPPEGHTWGDMRNFDRMESRFVTANWVQRHSGYFYTEYTRAALSAHTLRYVVNRLQNYGVPHIPYTFAEGCPKDYTTTDFKTQFTGPVVKVFWYNENSAPANEMAFDRILGMCVPPRCTKEDEIPYAVKWPDSFAHTPPLSPDQQEAVNVLKYVQSEEYWLTIGRLNHIQDTTMVTYHKNYLDAVDYILPE
jgi:hypothetical protein